LNDVFLLAECAGEEGIDGLGGCLVGGGDGEVGEATVKRVAAFEAELSSGGIF